MITCKRPLLLLAAAVILSAVPSLFAGPPEAPAPAPTPPADVIFNAGTFELQVADGLEFSQQRTGPLRPNIDYELTVLRLGYMIDSPHQGGTFLRGNDEIQLEGVGGAIFTGPGKTLGGLSLVYRRNFLAPGARLVPYLSGGGGGVYCDSYLDHQQRALGSAFEFDLQAGLGLRYRLATRVTLDAEVTYRHLSNADTAARNFGVNSIGGVVGASFTF